MYMANIPKMNNHISYSPEKTVVLGHISITLCTRIYDYSS